ncbi:uncharacterized protein PAC_07803 [Phialocephala subalpina]|uniref:RRM domain-containing protein n=1 Tax=Phialocephala subalpina TaxID=576137 RepID=A0A1L7WYR3_9HELO|nr:uncharacterized protein PAC_07803 [Phialocephala subalpina]
MFQEKDELEIGPQGPDQSAGPGFGSGTTTIGNFRVPEVRDYTGEDFDGSHSESGFELYCRPLGYKSKAFISDPGSESPSNPVNNQPSRAALLTFLDRQAPNVTFAGSLPSFADRNQKQLKPKVMVRDIPRDRDYEDIQALFESYNGFRQDGSLFFPQPKSDKISGDFHFQNWDDAVQAYKAFRKGTWFRDEKIKCHCFPPGAEFEPQQQEIRANSERPAIEDGSVGRTQFKRYVGPMAENVMSVRRITKEQYPRASNEEICHLFILEQFKWLDINFDDIRELGEIFESVEALENEYIGDPTTRRTRDSLLLRPIRHQITHRLRTGLHASVDFAKIGQFISTNKPDGIKAIHEEFLHFKEEYMLSNPAMYGGAEGEMSEDIEFEAADGILDDDILEDEKDIGLEEDTMDEVMMGVEEPRCEVEEDLKVDGVDTEGQIVEDTNIEREIMVGEMGASTVDPLSTSTLQDILVTSQLLY